jgi:hypothetical protein
MYSRHDTGTPVIYEKNDKTKQWYIDFVRRCQQERRGQSENIPKTLIVLGQVTCDGVREKICCFVSTTARARNIDEHIRHHNEMTY